MQSYATTATVEEEGQLHVAGVPFTPGTRVEVTIIPTDNGGAESPDASPNRAMRLLEALDKSRNTETVGPLRRAELYDRNLLY